MSSQLLEFEQRINTLNSEIEERLSNPEKVWEPILDGPLSIQHYFESELKVLWLMKEPYDADGGGWSFSGVFQSPNSYFYKEFVRGGSNRTWQPLTYVSHSLANDFTKWDDLEDIHEGMMESLQKIAFVNVQKLPSTNGNGTSTNMGHIYNAYQTHSEILHRQMSLLAPDVIICGGTFDVVCRDLNCQFVATEDCTDVHIAEGRVILDAYHPANTTVTRQRYVDSIIKAVKLGLSQREKLVR